MTDGVTTEAVLAVLGPDGAVTSVDGSAAMLAMAAAAITDRRLASPSLTCSHIVSLSGHVVSLYE